MGETRASKALQLFPESSPHQRLTLRASHWNSLTSFFKVWRLWLELTHSLTRLSQTWSGGWSFSRQTEIREWC